MVKQGRKSYLGPVEIASFSSQDFRRSNKHDTFWDIASTGYFYLLFLWVIAVSDFCPLEIFKHLDPPLSTIAFTVKSHPDKNFYKYIYLFQILWFFIETHVKVSYIQIWFKCKTSLWFFSNKNHDLHKRNSLQKKFFFCRLC